MSNSRGTVLAVDDEPNNLRILQFHLKREGYNVVTADGGKKGLESLQNLKDEVKVVLLDRMMPDMDGMEVLWQARKDKELKKIPVIMQTAAAEKNQVLEGIKAGVYYYLAKPFEPEVLLSIVSAAIEDRSLQQVLLDKVKQGHKVPGEVSNLTVTFRTMEEAKELAVFLAGLYSDPEKVIVGISAILENAVEHGNLAVSADEKKDHIYYNTWDKELHRLVSLPENRDKKVTVSFEKDDVGIKLRVKDEGKGFDWKPYMKLDPDRVTEKHGRGIALANMYSFDTMEYVSPGNEVICLSAF